MRPAGKARRPRISGIFEGGATPPGPGSPTRQPRWGGGGMQRRPNAGGLPPRAARWSLLAALAVEVVLFTSIAPNFLTLTNFFEVTRLSVEVGILAIAMTPVIVAGGIDLSVGAMMGLAAVMFGAAYRDWSFPVLGAAAVALLTGCAGGVLNAVLISRLNIPPLIVTLGSLSMFRGLAEGITHGAVNYSGFPPSVLRFGQGYLGGVVPAQLPVFLAVLAAYVLLLHRSI